MFKSSFTDGLSWRQPLVPLLLQLCVHFSWWVVFLAATSSSVYSWSQQHQQQLQQQQQKQQQQLQQRLQQQQQHQNKHQLQQYHRSEWSRWQPYSIYLLFPTSTSTSKTTITTTTSSGSHWLLQMKMSYNQMGHADSGQVVKFFDRLIHNIKLVDPVS